MHVLLCKYYDLVITEVWNSCKIMNEYLQMYTLVDFGKITYTHRFDTSK